MSNIQDLIDSRSKGLLEAYNNASVDQFMSFFSSDAKFSDYVMGAVDLDHAGTAKFMGMMFSIAGDLTGKTIATSGTSPDFVTWESELIFTCTQDNEKLGVKRGQTVTFNGVAIQHWREEDSGADGSKKWKIFKEADYFCKM